MRLWHKDMLRYLPQKQLLSQWRECCCIAKSIKEKGTPNHLLVNKIMNYPEDEFNTYADAVVAEMKRRGYQVDIWKFYVYRYDINTILLGSIFRGWHDKIYYRQCMANLMEKWQCGGLTTDEWICLLDGYKKTFHEEYLI